MSLCYLEPCKWFPILLRFRSQLLILIYRTLYNLALCSCSLISHQFSFTSVSHTSCCSFLGHAQLLLLSWPLHKPCVGLECLPPAQFWLHGWHLNLQALTCMSPLLPLLSFSVWAPIFFYNCLSWCKRLPLWLGGEESPYQCRRHGFDPWVRKSHWRRKWQPIPVCLPGKSHGKNSLAGYSPCGRKQSDMT